MQKYIHDQLRNNLRSIQKDLSVPQKKAVTEIVRGLFTAKMPVLRHLAQDESKSAKKQGEKYAHHSGAAQGPSGGLSYAKPTATMDCGGNRSKGWEMRYLGL